MPKWKLIRKHIEVKIVCRYDTRPSRKKAADGVAAKLDCCADFSYQSRQHDALHQHIDRERVVIWLCDDPHAAADDRRRESVGIPRSQQDIVKRWPPREFCEKREEKPRYTCYSVRRFKQMIDENSWTDGHVRGSVNAYCAFGMTFAAGTFSMSWLFQSPWIDSH